MGEERAKAKRRIFKVVTGSGNLQHEREKVRVGDLIYTNCVCMWENAGSFKSNHLLTSFHISERLQQHEIKHNNSPKPAPHIPHSPGNFIRLFHFRFIIHVVAHNQWEPCEGSEMKLESFQKCIHVSVCVCGRVLHENNTHNFPLIPQNRKLSLVEMKFMMLILLELQEANRGARMRSTGFKIYENQFGDNFIIIFLTEIET